MNPWYVANDYCGLWILTDPFRLQHGLNCGFLQSMSPERRSTETNRLRVDSPKYQEDTDWCKKQQNMVRSIDPIWYRSNSTTSHKQCRCTIIHLSTPHVLPIVQITWAERPNDSLEIWGPVEVQWTTRCHSFCSKNRNFQSLCTVPMVVCICTYVLYVRIFIIIRTFTVGFGTALINVMY